MTIAPEKREEIIEGLAKRNAERLKDSLIRALEEGWLLFHRGRPQVRLNGYMKKTIAEDLPYILDPLYLDLMHLGLAPVLPSVQMMEQRMTEALQVMETGVMMPSSIPEPPQLWPILFPYVLDPQFLLKREAGLIPKITLPREVFEKVAKDFRDLLKAEERRAEPSLPSPAY